MPGSSTALRRRHQHRRLRPGMLGTLGRACFRHRWLTLVTWLIVVACLITLWTRFGAPAQDNFTGNDPGQTLLNQHFHRQSGDTLTLAIQSTAPVGSPAVRARVASALVPFAQRRTSPRWAARTRYRGRSRRAATSRSPPSSSACPAARSATPRRCR